MSEEKKIKVKYLGHKVFGKVQMTLMCEVFNGIINVGDVFDLTQKNIDELPFNFEIIKEVVNKKVSDKKNKGDK